MDNVPLLTMVIALFILTVTSSATTTTTTSSTTTTTTTATTPSTSTTTTTAQSPSTTRTATSSTVGPTTSSVKTTTPTTTTASPTTATTVSTTTSTTSTPAKTTVHGAVTFTLINTSSTFSIIPNSSTELPETTAAKNESTSSGTESTSNESPDRGNMMNLVSVPAWVLYGAIGGLSFLVLLFFTTTLCCCCARRREQLYHEDELMQAKLLKNNLRTNRSNVNIMSEGASAPVDCERPQSCHVYDDPSPAKPNSAHFYDCLQETSQGLGMAPSRALGGSRPKKTKHDGSGKRKHFSISFYECFTAKHRKSKSLPRKRKALPEESNGHHGRTGRNDSGEYIKMNDKEHGQGGENLYDCVKPDRPASTASRPPRPVSAGKRNRPRRQLPPPPGQSNHKSAKSSATTQHSRNNSDKSNLAAEASCLTSVTLADTTRSAVTLADTARSAVKLADSAWDSSAQLQQQYGEETDTESYSSDGEWYRGSSGEEQDEPPELPRRRRRPPPPPPGDRKSRRKSRTKRRRTTLVDMSCQTGDLSATTSPAPSQERPQLPLTLAASSSSLHHYETFDVTTRHNGDHGAGEGRWFSSMDMSEICFARLPSKQNKQKDASLSPGNKDSQHEIPSPASDDRQDEDSRDPYANYDTPRSCFALPPQSRQPQHSRPHHQQDDSDDGLPDYCNLKENPLTKSAPLKGWTFF